MILTYRQVSVAEILLYVDKMSVTKLSEYFFVSRKVMYEDLESIKAWLKFSNAGKLIKNEHGCYHITVTNSLQMEELLLKETQMFRNYEIKERQALILYWFITTPNITLEQLISKVGVSRNTILNDFKAIRKFLAKQKIELLYKHRSYQFIGKELVIRAMVINALGPFAKKLIHLGYLQEPIHLSKKISPSSANDYYVLAIHVQQCRINNGCTLLHNFLPEKWAHLLEENADYESEYSKWLLNGLTGSFKKSVLSEICQKAVHKLINTITSLTTTKINKDGFKVLYNHLYQALYRAGLLLVLQNPILKEVETKNTPTFRVVKMAIQSTIPFNVNEQFYIHEASYLTLLLLSYMENESDIVVACYEGTSISYSIKQQLIALGFNSAKIRCLPLSQIKSEDILITTTILPKSIKAKKWIKVSPILNESDRSKLRAEFGEKMFFPQEILLEIVKRNVSAKVFQAIIEEMSGYSYFKGAKEIMLKELITEETILFAESITNWEKAIDLVASPLIKSGRIHPNYVESTKENIHKNGTYIVLRDEFALPHARPSGKKNVKQLSMSLLVLKKSVLLGEKQVPIRVMVFLAAADSTTHLKALSELIELLSNDQTFEKIKNSTTKEEILSLINKGDD